MLFAQSKFFNSGRPGNLEMQQTSEQVVQRPVLSRVETNAGTKVGANRKEDSHHLRRTRIVAVFAECVHGARIRRDELISRIGEQKQVAEAAVLLGLPLGGKLTRSKNARVWNDA